VLSWKVFYKTLGALMDFRKPPQRVFHKNPWKFVHTKLFGTISRNK
jgi:hypothetical protein